MHAQEQFSRAHWLPLFDASLGCPTWPDDNRESQLQLLSLGEIFELDHTKLSGSHRRQRAHRWQELK